MFSLQGRWAVCVCPLLCISGQELKAELVRKPTLQSCLIQFPHFAKMVLLALLSPESFPSPASLPLWYCSIWQCITGIIFMRPAIQNKLTLYLCILPFLVYPPWKNVITFVFKNTTDMCIFALKIESLKNDSEPSNSHLGNTAVKRDLMEATGSSKTNCPDIYWGVIKLANKKMKTKLDSSPPTWSCPVVTPSSTSWHKNNLVWPCIYLLLREKQWNWAGLWSHSSSDFK